MMAIVLIFRVELPAAHGSDLHVAVRATRAMFLSHPVSLPSLYKAHFIRTFSNIPLQSPKCVHVCIL